RGARRWGRPERRDQFTADVQEAGPDRGEQPFVEARAVEVAAEIGRLVRKVRECVCAVDDCFHAAAAGFVADALDRKDLTGEIRDVAGGETPGCRRTRPEQPIGELVVRSRRDRERDLRQLDAVTTY